MTRERIQELADFFYSSDNATDVPFRLSLSFGMAGDDISKDEFIEIMKWLSEGDISKESANELLVELENGV